MRYQIDSILFLTLSEDNRLLILVILGCEFTALHHAAVCRGRGRNSGVRAQPGRGGSVAKPWETRDGFILPFVKSVIFKH